MSVRYGPICETTFFIDAERAADLDDWLEQHVRETLRRDGLVDCRPFPIADDSAGRAGRVCQYVFDGDEALDYFLDHIAESVEPPLAEAFGDSLLTDTRILRDDTSAGVPESTNPDCLNCGTRLRGQYCGQCGQRARSRLISLWELIRDAFGDLFELDSRLWRTLIPLLARPGRLTDDYLKGRRARYMPPFRMYLVLSLLFFLVAFFDPRQEFGLLYADEQAAVEETSEAAMPEEVGEVLEDVEGEVREALTDAGIEIDDTAPAEGDDDAADAGPQVAFTIDDEEFDDDCDVSEEDLEDLPPWLKRRLTKERLERICERTQIDDGASFVDALLDNIPAALIVLLPLMALVLKLLYPFSRRYYVEHLLFCVHFHAFFFLILSLQILFGRLVAWTPIPEAVGVLTIVATSFYIPVYLFVAMRKVYHQGRLLTFFKYLLLVISYVIGFTVTMGAAVAIAAFSM